MAEKRPLAVFTVTQNDGVFLQKWGNHYRAVLPADVDLYVLDHETQGDFADVVHGLRARGMVVLPVSHVDSFDPHWLLRIVGDFQRFLLHSYRTVIFTAADELLILSPECDAPSLYDYITQQMNRAITRCAGYEVLQQQDEEPLDWSRPVLWQRRLWTRSEKYSRYAVTRLPVHWMHDFAHVNNSAAMADENLWLVHVHRADYVTCQRRHQERAARKWFLNSRDTGPYQYNLLEDPEQMWLWFTANSDDTSLHARLEVIPEAAKTLV
jgi:hypothetical protein